MQMLISHFWNVKDSTILTLAVVCYLLTQVHTI